MRPLAVALAAFVLAAGCVGEDPAEDPEQAAVVADLQEAPVDDGTTPMPDRAGALPHLHDYWQGRERATLFEGTIEPSQDEMMNATFARVFVEKQPMVGGTGFTLPDEAIVYEGTGQMDVTATWSDPTVTSLAMSYRSNPNAEWTTIALASGTPSVIEVTPEMTDMPHMSISRWEFLFSPSEPGAVAGPFDLKLEIVKLRDISLFPGHPDFFRENDTLVVDDSEHDLSEESYAARAPEIATVGAFTEQFVSPQNPIPMGTAWMHIEVHILEATATAAEVDEIRFFYHGADTSYIGHPFVLPTEGSVEEKRLVYAFPVAMEQTDSPYATESQWEFFVEPSTSFTGMDPSCGGCTDVHIKYHMTITVYDHEVDEPASKLEGEE